MPFSFSSINSLSEFKALYSQIEESAAITPYDQLLWIEHWFGTHSAPNGNWLLGVLVARDGMPFMILPFEVTNKFGVRFAKFMGEKHANYHFPIMKNNDEPLSLEHQKKIQSGVLACLNANDIDIITLERMLPQYCGVENPLFNISSLQINDSLLFTQLPSDFAAFAAERRDGTAAKRDRKQMAAISKLGEWHCIEGKTPQERVQILASFYTFKPKRLAAKGVENVFGDTQIQNFIKHLTVENDNGAFPLRLFALKLNDQIIAVNASLISKNHAAGMFNAIDPTYQDIIHPGLVLLRHEIEFYCKSGVNLFDLGVGEARYKRTWLKDEWHIRTLIVPLSFVGKVIGYFEFGKYILKHRIKHSKFLWKLVQKLRALKGKTANSKGVE